MIRKEIISMVIILAVSGIHGILMAAEYHPRPSADIKSLPDLTVTAKFAKVEKFKNSSGVQCYGIRPYFTITNTGSSAARNFRYEIEWNYTPTHIWQIYTLKNEVSLGPGNTISIDGSSPVWNLPWCADETDWTPGWRIRVDTENSVPEINEQNNSAVIFFHPLIGRPPLQYKPGAKKVKPLLK